MDEEAKRELTVNGFQFGSKEDVELAEQELSTVKYIEGRIQNRGSDTIMSVYKGAIERKMFRTPVGYAYMHDLQKKMAAMGVRREDIPGVPLYQIYNNNLSEEVTQRRTITIPKRKKKSAIIRMNRTLIMVNIILILLIIALFVINIKGSTPTVLNYKYAIENEYASWEQELKERENAVREKERELNIVNNE
ncbi:MAG: hypothetical protein IKQ83_04820 [Lachnospiraceae bacterium]|nr:hypothetical protein [Lachnospiraceae bacterium]